MIIFFLSLSLYHVYLIKQEKELINMVESDSGVSFHQLLTPDSKQKIITIEVCIYKSLSEKAMATHSDTLAWKIPWTEEPGRLQSMGLLRVGHD